MRARQYVVLLIVVATAVLGALTIQSSLPERVSLLLNPSADKAYAYGSAYIASSNPDYDLSTAGYFFRQAARLDPKYPYVHHQLARVHFLSADYPAALVEINLEIANDVNKDRASAYYLRGLIAGYLNDYESAVRDYKHFVQLNPERWEGRTDYAWVLIKTGDFKEALSVIDAGLAQWPDNPWLLSVRAAALFEQGRLSEALPEARAAALAVDAITEELWLKAYPGNSPEVAEIGIETLRNAARGNLEKIERAAREKDANAL